MSKNMFENVFVAKAKAAESGEESSHRLAATGLDDIDAGATWGDDDDDLGLDTEPKEYEDMDGNAMASDDGEGVCNSHTFFFLLLKDVVLMLVT